MTHFCKTGFGTPSYWPCSEVRAAEAVEVLTAPREATKDNSEAPQEPQDEHQLIVLLVAAAWHGLEKGKVGDA